MASYTAKAMVGCLDRGGRPTAGYGATAVTGYVCPGNGTNSNGVAWSELQSTPEGPLIGHKSDFSGTNPIDKEITWIRANAPTLMLKLRICTGLGSVALAIAQLDNGPVYTDNAPHTLPYAGVWWGPNFLAAWKDLMTKLAAAYDTVPEIGEITYGITAIDGCEPFLTQEFNNTNPASANAAALGWTYTAQETAMQNSIDFMPTVFSKTPYSLSFNPALWVVNGGPPAGEAVRYPKAMIDRIRAKAPLPMGVQENNSLLANSAEGATATTPAFGTVSSTGVVTNGRGANYDLIYAYMIANSPKAYNSGDPGQVSGAMPICYQTATLAKLGNNTPANQSLGLLNTINMAIAYGARSVELPGGYGGASGLTAAQLTTLSAGLAGNDVTRTYSAGGSGPTTPGQVIGVTVTAVGDGVATLSWTPGTTGGAPILRNLIRLILNGTQVVPDTYADAATPIVVGSSALGVGAASVTAVYGSATAKNLLVALVTGHQPAGTAFTCSDGTWVAREQFQAGAVENAEVWEKVAAGSDTIPTWSGTGASAMGVVIVELNDPNGGTPVYDAIGTAAGTNVSPSVNSSGNDLGGGRLVLFVDSIRLGASGANSVTEACNGQATGVGVTVLGDNGSDATKASHHHSSYAVSHDFDPVTPVVDSQSLSSTAATTHVAMVEVAYYGSLAPTVALSGLEDSQSYIGQVFPVNSVGMATTGGASPSFSPVAPVPPAQPTPYVPPIQSPDFTYVDTTPPGDWVFYGCDLMTNAVMAELPLLGTQLTVALDAAGAWTANIPLSTALVPLDLMDATEPGRTRLYAVRDGAVVFGGIIWTRNYDSTSETLQLGGNQFWSYYARRRIKFTQAYKAEEQFAVVQDIIARLSLLAGDPGFAFNYVGGPTPTLVSASYVASDEAQVDQAILTFAQAIGGFDIAEDYYIDPATGYPNFMFTLSYPRRGQTGQQNADYVFEMPGNIISYQWPEDATSGATTMTDTGGGSGTGQLQETASNTNLIDAGYPLLEGTTSHADVTDPGVLANLATADLNASTPPVIIPVVTVNPAQSPTLGTYSVGDAIRLTIVDPRFNSGVDPTSGKYLSPGLDTFQRVISYQIFPQDDSQQESVAVTFGQDS